jgi:hypothetical protein
MKAMPHCLECRQPISQGVHEFSQRLYGHSLCMKDQYLLGESGADALVVDLYLALKSLDFPLVLEYFDGYRQVDIALPGKLYIEVNASYHSGNWERISDLTESVYSLENKIPTIIISDALLDTPGTFAHAVNELSKACRLMLKPSYEYSVACAPPLTAAQLQ